MEPQNFIARRLGNALLRLFVASVVIFLVGFSAPNLIERIVGPRAAPEAREALAAAYGLDQPLPVQYVRWIGGLLTGNLGLSSVERRPVSETLGERLGPTLELAGLALLAAGGVLALLAALEERFPVGVRQAERLLASLPDFWLALALMLVFAVSLGWLPLAGRSAPSGDGPGPLAYLLLPTATLAVATVGAAVRARERLKPAARGSGLAAALPGLFSSAVVVEVVFAWPGWGRLMAQAATRQDFWMMLALVMALTTAVITVQTLIELVSGPHSLSAASPRSPRAARPRWLPKPAPAAKPGFAGQMERFTFSVSTSMPAPARLSTAARLAALQAAHVPPTANKRPDDGWQTGFQDAGREPERGPTAGAPTAGLLAALVVGLVLIGAAAPVQRAAIYNDPSLRLLPPGTAGLPLGTDSLGRDLLARVIVGGQTTLTIGLIGGLVAVGMVWTLGTADARGQRAGRGLLDTLRAIPALPLLLLIAAVHQPTSLVVVVVVGLLAAAAVAPRLRMAEGVTAQALGAALALGMGSAILLESSLSFLGFGVQPPTPSWGNLLSDALQMRYFAANLPILVVVGALLVGTGMVLQGLGRRVR